MSNSFKDTINWLAIIGLCGILWVAFEYSIIYDIDHLQTIEFQTKEINFNSKKILSLKTELNAMKVEKMERELTNSALYLQWKSNK